MLTGLASVVLSSAVHAIEPSQIWVNSVQPTGSVPWYESGRAEALSASIVRPWLNQELSGELLDAWSGDATTALLQVPVGVERFTRGTLEITGADSVQVFINGNRLPVTEQRVELNMQTGDHQLLVLVGGVENWHDVTLDWQGKDEHDVLTTERPSRFRLNAEQLFDAKTTTGLDISPDGEHVVWRRQYFTEQTGDTPQQQVELMNLASRRVVFAWNDPSVSQFSWHPNGETLAYVQNNRIHSLQIGGGSIRQHSEELPRLGALRWLNDDTLVFTLSERDDEHDGQVKRYRALEDRWNYFRQRTDVYTLRLDDDVLSQVSQFDERISLQDVSAAGDYLLISQSLVDYSEAPHSLTRLLQVQVNTGETQTIGEYRTFNQARYAEEGLYVVAGPEFADHAGRNLDDDALLANNYDGQLYRVSINGDEVEALSREFDPAIGSIDVIGNDLLVRTTDRDRAVLYHYSAAQSQFHRIDQAIEMVDNVSISQSGTPRLVYAGTSATTPQRTYMQDLNDSAQLLWDSADDYYRLNTIADTREWNFNNERGDTIYGRIYLPHDFDPSKKYPALVYYYGGTTPVSRNFTGRYPFNLWADMGYVVYVLQPTGAIGFGQEFSARHVNAWGEDTVDDIIEGTRRFIDEHEFVDGERVGNMGASYGGFMTMLLATKTDLFAASMSHAGISHISSYWGHGWWGFGYSGEASKGSFPWNAPELYRERSPLNFADQINNPLLLIHGDSDTNVPPGESHMMYTALKMLDKDVELVEFIGEDHGINRRTPRLLWWQTYMAFFDMHLKDQPQWWEHLYSDR